MRAALLGIALTLAGCGGRPRGPELYGAGLFTTGEWDFFLAFSPDQRRVLFCRANDDFSRYRILQTVRDPGGRWHAPTTPGFAREWSNADPHISPDGRRVFFISDRPAPGQSGEQPTQGLWYAALDSTGEWSDAKPLPSSISVAGVDEWSPSVAANGSLYFGTEREGGRGDTDIWVSRLVDGVYQAPENLGDSVNTAGSEVEPWIAPDESYLIFSGIGRADSVGRYDLYWSRKVGGVWQRAHLLDHGVNTRAPEFNQSVSPDGRWLYFSSTRKLAGPIGERFDSPRDERNIRGIGNGKGDIYRISLRELGIE
jgi:Tol biopolymer transport system component